MSIEQKNNLKRGNLRMRGIGLSARVLSLSICVMTLSGCATKPLDLSVNCPEPVRIPVALKESNLPDACACSAEAQKWLSDVRQWLKTVR